MVPSLKNIVAIICSEVPFSTTGLAGVTTTAGVVVTRAPGSTLPSIANGTAVQLTATGNFSDGTEIEIAPVVTICESRFPRRPAGQALQSVVGCVLVCLASRGNGKGSINEPIDGAAYVDDKLPDVHELAR